MPLVAWFHSSIDENDSSIATTPGVTVLDACMARGDLTLEET